MILIVNFTISNKYTEGVIKKKQYFFLKTLIEFMNIKI